MPAFRWFQVFLLASNVARILTNEGHEEVPPSDLNQAEAEAILSFQSNLRRNLIKSLTDIREKITQFEEPRSTVDEIIQGLRSRTLDPFGSLGSIGGQSDASQMAEMIHNLQGRRATSLSEWEVLLQTIPDVVPPRPNIRLMPEYLQKIHKIGGPFVVFVLTGIQENSLKPNKKILGDILYNYRFRDFSSDLEIILDNVREVLEESVLSFSDFRTDPDSIERPDDILSAVLKHVSRQSDQRFAYQIAHLLSALSKQPNAIRVKEVSQPWRLFDLMLLDDYPIDVIETKNALSSELRSSRLDLDLSEVVERLKGYPPREQLLMLVAKLTALPSGTSLSWKAHAVYPHVKLRHLRDQGKFFRPRTASDVGFLFDSFLSASDEMNPTLLEEIRRVFLRVDFDLEDILKGFDYSRYSKPRPLVLDMAQEMLRDSKKLPVCFVIVLRYFLANKRQTSPHGVPVEGTSTSPTASLALSSDVEKVTWPAGELIPSSQVQGHVAPSIPTPQPSPPLLLTTSTAPTQDSASIVASYKLHPSRSVATEPSHSSQQEVSGTSTNSTETPFLARQPTLPDAVTTRQSLPSALPSALSTLFEVFPSSPATMLDAPSSTASSPIPSVTCRSSEHPTLQRVLGDLQSQAPLSADSLAETITSPQVPPSSQGLLPLP